MLADTNAHLATTVEGKIGTPLNRKQNVPAEIMLEYLEVVNQALPSTYDHLNTEPRHPTSFGTGEGHTVDFIMCLADMLSSCLSAGVDLSIDLALESIDHHAVFLEVAFKKQHA